MAMPFDGRDALVMGLVTAAEIAATTYLFKHPDTTAFGIWTGFTTTIIGFYHWICVFDSKRPDAPGVTQP
jgi:hypothetical protein